MGCILICGRNRNHLKHALAASGLSASGNDVATNFPLSALCDDDTLPFQFGSKAANRYVQVDVNAIVDGGFEASGANGVAPAAWTVKTGTLVTNNTGPDSGTYSGMLGGNGHIAYQILLRPAGEAFTFSPRAKGGGAGVAANVRVVNLDTGYSLNSSGVWVAGVSTYFISNYTTSGSYTGSPASGVVQAPSICGTDLCRIMISLEQTGGSAGNTRYDSLAWIPQTNFLALLGHNVPPAISTILYRSSTGAFGGEEVAEATLTFQPRNMYYAGSTLRTERYWRIYFSGTVDSGLPTSSDTSVKAIGLTEVFLGQKSLLTQPQDFGYDHDLVGDQGRSKVGGWTRIYLRNPAPIEAWELDFQSPTSAAYDELRDLVYATQLGAVKAVLVPDDSRRDVAYGPIDVAWKSQRQFLNTWNAHLRVESMPAAVFVS